MSISLTNITPPVSPRLICEVEEPTTINDVPEVLISRIFGVFNSGLQRVDEPVRGYQVFLADSSSKGYDFISNFAEMVLEELEGRLSEAAKVMLIKLIRKKGGLTPISAIPSFSALKLSVIEMKNTILEVIGRVILDESEVNEFLFTITKALCAQGKVDGAFEIARNILVEPIQSQALLAVVSEVSREGDIDWALQISSAINDEYIQSIAFGETVEGLCRQGRLSKAFEIARTITNVLIESQALLTIVQTLCSDGDFQEARKVAEIIFEPFWRFLGLKEIVRCLCEEGDFEEARKVAETISDPKKRAHVLKRIDRIFKPSKISKV